ncbi:MAG: hypothetical protein ACYTHJ_20120 [Planctomycetota bacterium]|jgi:hypothetical protein
MKQLTTTFQAALALCFVVLGNAATAQGQACSTDANRVAACDDGNELIFEVCNADLSDVEGWTETILDGEGDVLVQGTRGFRMCNPNLSVATVLSRLDIDGDGVADNSPDTDGDGLPDSWEVGGRESIPVGADEAVDRVVFFPAPSAIVPGTPPTTIFARRAVATDALNPDTDGDGLTDYTEVFGLMFIDEDRNGRLDPTLEWDDTQRDGLPSPGEHPIDNSGTTVGERGLLHDFDGFVFTDPTNPDTDGDSVDDRDDVEPLINLRAFGNQGQLIVRFNAEGNADIDQDGLGNAMDMGNDIVSSDPGSSLTFQVIDNPQDLSELLELFRPDLLGEGVIPESVIEDLLGIDWDGNGLWRTTDVREWSLIIEDPASPPTTAADNATLRNLFRLDPDDPDTALYAQQTFEELEAIVTDPQFDLYGGGVLREREGGSSGIGLGWQEILRPTGPSTLQFIPDERIWAILYAWRMPGFDIDGDGFVGPPNLSSTFSFATNPDNGRPIASVAWERQRNGSLRISNTVEIVPADEETRSIVDQDRAFDDFITIGDPTLEDPGLELDGIIEAPTGVPGFTCGTLGFLPLLLTAMALVSPRFVWRRSLL